mmetsp:Transcript_71488/g.117669  ORF Transcript_71488/g.117669 Transcript_71488/m.117669 type:complete len:120 (+) Transcript_71488:162-521(+)
MIQLSLCKQRFKILITLLQSLCRRGWQQQQVPSLYGAVEVTGLSPGVLQTTVVTAPESRRNSEVYSRYKPHGMPSLQSCQMGRLLHGAIHSVVVIAQLWNTSSKVYSKFRPQLMHFLPY